MTTGQFAEETSILEIYDYPEYRSGIISGDITPQAEIEASVVVEESSDKGKGKDSGGSGGGGEQGAGGPGGGPGGS